nr:MAG TPA: hypothetical protein [Caudoviricetes sp.]
MKIKIKFGFTIQRCAFFLFCKTFFCNMLRKRRGRRWNKFYFNIKESETLPI